MDFPKFRTYKKPDGTWAERELVPEYLEQAQLERIWHEIMTYENWFSRCHNPLLIMLRLSVLENELRSQPESLDTNLLYRIAVSVYQNAPVSF